MNKLPHSINEKYIDLNTIEKRFIKWDNRFLELAALISTWSKDPSTQVGAVVVDNKQRIISTGFNGFARGILDSEERYNDRETKYKIILHAEDNALLFAQKDLEGCTIYTYPFPPCSKCAPKIIQCGVKRVVAPVIPDHLVGRWGEDCAYAASLFWEAKVDYWLYK